MTGDATSYLLPPTSDRQMAIGSSYDRLIRRPVPDDIPDVSPVRMPMRCSSPLSCVVRKELAMVRRLLPSLLGIAKSSYISRRYAFRLACNLFSTRIVNRGSRRRQE